MKILSAAQIKEADRHTISSEPISSTDLMERAAMACVRSILRQYDVTTKFVVVCGMGNNGGDGLAIARLLAEQGCEVRVYIAEYKEGGSDDYAHNLERLRMQDKATITPIRSGDELELRENEAVIDAILGTGINKPTEGLIATVIDKINKSGLQVTAIDVPSGMNIDGPSAKKASIIHAARTLTFQQPKLAFMFAESADYVGEFEVLDIGLNTSSIPDKSCLYSYLQSEDIAPLLRTRPKFSHKGTFGHALLITGAYGKMGAAVLASRACLRSGAGLLTVHIPASGYQILQTAVPEAMADPDTHADHISGLPDTAPYSSIGIGPGIGTGAASAKVLKKLIQTVQAPIVIDADALNMISENKTWLGFLTPMTILTPHPKEYDRLSKIHGDSWERLASAQAMAKKHGIIIVLKGAHTAVALPDGSVWFNSTGNPALAKGGSGDVLTGIITALLGRGYGPSIAAAIGVYIHGLAADIAVKEINAESLMATDIVEHLSSAFDQLYGQKAGYGNLKI